MNRFFSAKPLLAAALALGSLAAASAAHARTDVVVSVGFPFVQAAPVYVQPQPVYVQPRHVYVQPQPVYVQPARHGWDGGYERRAAWGDADHDGVPNLYDRDSRFYDHRAAQRSAAWRDADHDGVPNRYDRMPNNPYRR